MTKAGCLRRWLTEESPPVLSRRDFFGGLLATPAIIPAARLMPLSLPKPQLIIGYDLAAGADQTTLLILTQITREVVKMFQHSNAFMSQIDRQYADEFLRGGKGIGTTLRIRLPKDYTLIRGDT